MNSTDLAQARSECSGNMPRTECTATLVGTVAASFGSPIITNGSIIWTGGSSAANAGGRGAPALQEGEYACYGNGSQVLAGLGFIASADGTYTDLDHTTGGSYFVEGSEVFFVGGRLGGETGRELDAVGSFVIGDMAVCEPW
ncbi:hypothetical protein [Devosia aurantiaca]|uniref:Uncharacterized protein n=1 Tax=Devosia aurantiaca TaxID=2714858 RepID=A0A6M1SFV1_9HYPH|nr:hypothetical protein [Devosia aurantiaca]NGP18387.1 hypothetical protein [Devosia aurantiaca]